MVMVVDSVFGLERNSLSLHPLQGCYQISGGWDYRRAFQVDCFNEEPEGKSKYCAGMGSHVHEESRRRNEQRYCFYRAGCEI
jgi:hypothetical protein